MNLLLFVGNHCQRESTLTIVTSECSRPLSGVTLYSRNYMAIVSSSNGRYRIRACSLPLYVTLKKYGYRTMRVIVRRSTEKFTMRCLGMLIDRMVASYCCLCYHMVLGDTTLLEYSPSNGTLIFGNNIKSKTGILNLIRNIYFNQKTLTKNIF